MTTKHDEIERILTMTDDEIFAEAKTEGRDIAAEATRSRLMFERIKRLIDAKKQPPNGD